MAFPLFLAMIVDAMGFGLVYPLVTELFAGEQGVHLAEGISIYARYFFLGLSFLLYPFASFFGAPLMEKLSFRWGKKNTLLLCLGGVTFSYFLMGLGVAAFSLFLLLLGRMLSGFMTSSQTLASVLLLDARVENLKVVTLIMSVGIVLGPLFAGIFSDPNLATWFTLSTPFFLAAALGLFTWVWIAFTLSETSQDKEIKKEFNPLKIVVEGFQNEKVRPLVLIFICMQIGFSLFYQLIQPFVAHVYGYPSWELGVFNGYIGIAFALVVLTGKAAFLRFFKAESITALSLFLTGVCLVLAMLFPWQLVVWVLAFAAAGFDMLAYGSLMSCFASSVEVDKQQWALNLFASLFLASWTLTGLFTSLVPLFGLRSLITLGGFFLLLAAFLMIRYNRRALTLNFNR